METSKYVEYTLSKKTVTGEVIKDNPKTVIVMTPDGKAIKRHKLRHHVHSYGS